MPRNSSIIGRESNLSSGVFRTVQSLPSRRDKRVTGRITSRLIEPKRRKIGGDKGKPQNRGVKSWEKDDKRSFFGNRSRGPLSLETSTKLCLIAWFRGPFFAEGSLPGSLGKALSNVSRRSGKRWMVVERWNLGWGRKRRIKWTKGEPVGFLGCTRDVFVHKI